MLHLRLPRRASSALLFLSAFPPTAITLIGAPPTDRGGGDPYVVFGEVKRRPARRKYFEIVAGAFAYAHLATAVAVAWSSIVGASSFLLATLGPTPNSFESSGFFLTTRPPARVGKMSVQAVGPRRCREPLAIEEPQGLWIVCCPTP